MAVQILSVVRIEDRCLLILEDLHKYEPIGSFIQKTSDQQRKQMVMRELLNSVSLLNSKGLFHNNLTLSNVLVSGKLKIKIHELDTLSKFGAAY